MSIGKRILHLRESHNMTQKDLAGVLDVTDKAVSTWENDLKIPRMGTIQKIADYFHTTKSYIVDGDKAKQAPFDIFAISGIVSIPKTKKIPLIGTIACGAPIIAEQNIEGYVSMPENIDADFALICKGDSMIGARIYDGDHVYIRSQPDVEDGEIAAVLIGEEATLKRVYKIGHSRLELRAENPAYPPLHYTGEELNEIRIIGKAVFFSSMIR